MSYLHYVCDVMCVFVYTRTSNQLIGDAWKIEEEDNRVQAPTIFSNLIWAKPMKNYRSPFERLWNNEQTDRQTDGHCFTVVLFSSPVWCTAACHWSAVCACPSKESSSSWLLPLSLYLEAIKVLLSEKWTDKEGSVSGWEKNGRALQRKSVISSHAQQGPERHWVLRWHFSSGWGGAVSSVFLVDVVTLTLLSVSYK